MLVLPLGIKLVKSSRGKSNTGLSIVCIRYMGPVASVKAYK